MAQQDAIEQLRGRFTKPLDEFSSRRVVFWHDVDGSFEGVFDGLSEEALQSPRQIHLLKIEDNALFAAKRMVSRQFPSDDFLIYTRRPKDLSVGALEANWLADLEIISEHFQADFASMLMEELGATDSAIDGIEYFRTFFNANDRKERFTHLMPHAQNREDVTLGVIGSVLASPDLSTESLVRTYLISLSDGKTPLEALGKYGADSPFATFISKRLGYTGDLSSASDMAAHLLLTALSFQLPEGMLDGLESRISPPHGQFCLNIVQSWMADDSAVDALYRICRNVEVMCGLNQRFSQMTATQLVEADVSPGVNERILVDLCSSLAQGADRTDEALRVIQRRKDLRWFSRVRPYFKALDAAVLSQRFYREHTQGFHYAVPLDVWKAYTTEWYAMDAAYRAFCQAFKACSMLSSDIPELVSGELDNLASWVERIYVNWFLLETNTCWINAAQEDWEKVGYIEGVPYQRRFFDEIVVAGSAGVKKTMVIISDALRFEVAQELSSRLDRETAGSTDIKSMQSVFPSITEFGMAALLPHSSLSYNASDGDVYIDGNMPTVSTEDRQKVLQKAKPGGVCLRGPKLLSAKRSERKALVGDADFIYVYHDKIDTTGEHLNTEGDVFKACDEAIEELVALVKIATNDLAISRVIITADHGFLYTRDPLEERDRVSKKDIEANVVKQGRRFMISDEFDLDSALFIQMNMNAVEGGVYTGLAPRDCVRIKKAGPGENYVHGGMSLQECCVPVIQYRYKRAGSKSFEERQGAEFKLLSTNRRITSMMFKLELFQKEPVGGKVLSTEYELVMTDAAGNQVSDIRRAHADMQTTDETARVSRVRFGLKAGMQYDAKANYYLVCRNKSTGNMAWKEEFQIDIAFVPMDDFGF